MTVSKWVLAVGTAGFLTVGCMVPAHAQMAPKRPNAAGGPMMRHPLLGRMAWVLSKLDLTSDQKERVKGFLEGAQVQAKGIRENTTLTPVQKRTQMQSIIKALRGSITDILTLEQKEKARRLLASAPGPRPMLVRWMTALSQLDLAPAQKAQIKDFFTDAQAKAKIIRESNMGPADKRVKMQGIEKGLRENILGALTPTQKQKLQQMLKQA